MLILYTRESAHIYSTKKTFDTASRLLDLDSSRSVSRPQVPSNDGFSSTQSFDTEGPECAAIVVNVLKLDPEINSSMDGLASVRKDSAVDEHTTYDSRYGWDTADSRLDSTLTVDKLSAPPPQHIPSCMCHLPSTLTLASSAASLLPTTSTATLLAHGRKTTKRLPTSLTD
ncbi:hypothetical protein ONZ51_g8784 [Trametes cubensis]|uniref:Uncharacterized protein n=1 Tax=Trametes cubensis TaxID=1111947 RepID=A0AAD7X8Y3_9APHY|nr:hypothetical protein ONZ51_g8784 [Trametes cubensis]